MQPMAEPGRVVDLPMAAHFALVRDSPALSDLALFHPGEPDYPDRSTTLIVAVAEMGPGPLLLEGPGSDGQRALGAAPLPADFAARLSANAAGFPLGVDLVLCGPGRVGARPLTVRVSAPRRTVRVSALPRTERDGAARRAP